MKPFRAFPCPQIWPSDPGFSGGGIRLGIGLHRLGVGLHRLGVDLHRLGLEDGGLDVVLGPQLGNGLHGSEGHGVGGRVVLC